jgi:hypothetical protein
MPPSGSGNWFQHLQTGFWVNIFKTGLYSSFHKSKLIALGFLVISLIGVKGKKDEKQTYKTAFAYMLTGLLFYFISYLVLLIQGQITTVAIAYMVITAIGFMLACQVVRSFQGS